MTNVQRHFSGASSHFFSYFFFPARQNCPLLPDANGNRRERPQSGLEMYTPAKRSYFGTKLFQRAVAGARKIKTFLRHTSLPLTRSAKRAADEGAKHVILRETSAGRSARSVTATPCNSATLCETRATAAGKNPQRGENRAENGKRPRAVHFVYFQLRPRLKK